jgi:outer membrane protein assembly factor BamB
MSRGGERDFAEGLILKSAVWFITLLLTAAAGSAEKAFAENWPGWRGPLASSVSPEKGLPTRWSETENVAWKAPIRGLGISSPVVWGDRIFVTSQTGSGTSRPGPRLFEEGDASAVGERRLGDAAPEVESVKFLVTAFDRASGRRLWEYELPADGDLQPVHEKHNLASSSPVTDGERVYAWFGTGQLVALNLDGKLAWKRNLGEYGRFDINWGHGSSPAVYGGAVLLVAYHPAASYLMALDSKTGSVRWKVDRDEGVTSYSTPLVIETARGPEIVVNSSRGLGGHSLADGELLWHVEWVNRFPIPTPLEQDGIIYTSQGSRSSPYMAIRPGGSGNVTDSHVLWRTGTGAPYISSLVLYDGLIYMAGDVGVITASDARTGQRVWQERVGGVFTASPVAGDGKIYLLSEGGETIVFAAGRTPRVIARNKLNTRQLASPAISGGRLFIRSDDALYAIGN